MSFSGRRPLSIALTVAVALLVAAEAYRRPELNWDALAYAGAAAELTGADAGRAQRTAYEAAERFRGGEGPLLSEGHHPEYRRTMRTDAEAFHATLGWYRARIGYTAPVALLMAAGINGIEATVAVSALSGAGIVLLLSAAGRRWKHGALLPAALVTAAVLGMVRVARFSTPDALATLVLFGAFLLLRDGRRSAYALFPFAMLVRSDLLVPAVIIAVLHAAVVPKHRIAAAAGIAASLLVVFGLHHWSGYPGWSEAYLFTFAGSTGGTFDGALFLSSLGAGVSALGTSTRFFAAAGMTAAGLAVVLRSGADPLRHPAARWLLVAVLIIGARLLLFPMMDVRFLVMPYIIIIVATTDIVDGIVRPAEEP